MFGVSWHSGVTKTREGFMFKVLAILLMGVFGVLMAQGGSIVVGGVEDWAGSTPIEGKGDFNDLMFQMSGNFSVLAPLGGLLTPGMVNESGAIFWDQQSYDGSDYNFGYCVTGWGDCTVPGVAAGPLDYFAGQGGAAPINELFQASGPVTLMLLMKETSNYNVDNLGWYDPAHPGVLHQIFAGPDGMGTSVIFTPSSVFALYSSNGMGQIYSSVAAGNVGESTTQQHFALLQVETPEPGAMYLTGAALAVCAVFWMSRAKRY
jgi:hypothetical protein